MIVHQRVKHRSSQWLAMQALKQLPLAPNSKTTLRQSFYGRPPKASSLNTPHAPPSSQPDFIRDMLSLNTRDVRSNPTPKAAYHEVHSDDVTTLAFHPSTPELLLSGSTDGLVSVHDTRIPDEDDLTIQTFNHNASIHHAGFLTSTEVVALSHDERFALYDMAEERPSGDATQDFGDMRTVLDSQYVADVTPKLDGSGAVVGAGAQESVSLSFLTASPSMQPLSQRELHVTG